MLRSAVHDVCDVAIVGAGPAGLAAAVYLARFLRSVVVFDAGDARARLIPRTHNCPGFPDGIPGEDLLARLKQQTKVYGTEIIQARVDCIERTNESFILKTTTGVTHASCVVLATGIVDKVPAIEGLHDAIGAGTIRLCPVCDAYEAAGKRIGVIGPDHLALKEALFLGDFSRHVCLIVSRPEDVTEAVRAAALAANVEICDLVDHLDAHDGGVEVVMRDGSARQIDVLYPAMGCDVRSELAANLGADCDDDGYVLVGAHLETSITGLYAIGDVARALNQIAVGFGHAALASAHIHNALRRCSSLDAGKSDALWRAGDL